MGRENNGYISRYRDNSNCHYSQIFWPVFQVNNFPQLPGDTIQVCTLQEAPQIPISAEYDPIVSSLQQYGLNNIEQKVDAGLCVMI